MIFAVHFLNFIPYSEVVVVVVVSYCPELACCDIPAFVSSIQR
jgi:hypothetical protein